MFKRPMRVTVNPKNVPPMTCIFREIFPDETPLTIGDVADRVADRGFGLLLVLLALPTLIPVLPPGSATVIGALYVFLAFQMLRGTERPWLPQRVRAYRISSEAIVKIRKVGVKIFEQIERVSRPPGIVLADLVATRLVGGGVLIVGLVLLSPLPFLHTLPGLTALLLGAGLLNHDGFLVFTGLILILVILGIVAIGGSALHTFLHSL